MSRPYSMSTREAALRRTREAILDAATEHFRDEWFDRVTLADVARVAGVSQQTVVNHFGSKLQLYLAAVAERRAPGIQAVRDRAVVGDVRSVVDCVVRDYEETGDATVRAIALADREPELAAVIEGGHRAHRAWVESVLAPQLARRRGANRARLATLLVVALDVATWRQLRRTQGLEPDEVATHLEALVEALVAG